MPNRIVTPNTDPPGATRDKITADQLSNGFAPGGMIPNGYFLPVGTHQAALHEPACRRTVAAAPMTRNRGGSVAQNNFPGFALDFITHGGFLVPAQRRIHKPTAPSFWTIICSPGRVWSEPSDGGMSRAAFPFVLANQYDNGVATFV